MPSVSKLFRNVQRVGALLCFAASWICLPVAAFAQTGLVAVPIGTFTNPVHVATAPGYGRLLFVVERPGQIQVLFNEQRLRVPFLDIRDRVFGAPDAGAGGEQGLLSVAFAPDYLQSKRFYVFYTKPNGDIQIDEFQRSSSAARADLGTRRVVLVIPHRDAHNHYGGQMQFGPDGLLYISTGDGGNLPAPGVPGDPARNLGSLLGKILRIDPRQEGSLRYSIPPTNPFVNKTGRDEIFAYGLRNPWRFSFDREVLSIGDVGQAEREEVNMLSRSAASGVNFGWPQYEGDLLYSDRPGPHPPEFPIHAYSHAAGGCSVIGGFVVRDPGLPHLQGRYLYGDYCTGELRSFVPDLAAQEAVDDRPTGLVLDRLASFGQAKNGQIYAAQTRGTVYRLEASSP